MNNMESENKRVSHPSYYNNREDNIECIEVIRHYVFDIACPIKYMWRAGLKGETGISSKEKEVEDLRKALWYIDDYKNKCESQTYFIVGRVKMNSIFKKLTGYTIQQVTSAYVPTIATAMECLLGIGIINNSEVRRVVFWKENIAEAESQINARIMELSKEA